MRKLKIYLDTSVINFLFADDAPDYREATIEFFENHIQKYDVYISEVVLFEIEKIKEPLFKNELMDAISKYPIQLIETGKKKEIGRLAEMYIKEKIIPRRKREDALHIAICTFYEFDVLLSWNFKHLANINKQIRINSVNEREGYLKTLNLLNPLEVIDEND